MNIKRNLILLTSIVLMGCLSSSVLIYEQRVALSSSALQVKVFDRGKRLSTRHVMIQVNNIGNKPVTLTYSVAISGEHNKTIHLDVLFKEQMDLLDEPTEASLTHNKTNELNNFVQQEQSDFITHLYLPAGSNNQVYLDTSINSKQQITVKSMTVINDFAFLNKNAAVGLKKSIT